MASENAAAKTAEVKDPISVPVLNAKGESVGTVTVDPAAFGGKVNQQLLHDVVLMHEANQRAGTHSTLRRGQVAGSTKKLFRQKGTGNARVGTRRSNKRRGGGTAKGPKPRDYEYHLPKKAVRAATRMAILSKFRDSQAAVLDGFAVSAEAPRTKEVAGVIKAVAKAMKLDEVPPAPQGQEPLPPEKVKAKGKRQLKHATFLIGIAGSDEKLYKSARNIRGVELLPVSQFNAYAVLKPKRLLLTRDALEALSKKA